MQTRIRTFIAITIVGLNFFWGTPTLAQEARLALPNLDALARQASDSVDITLDTGLLRLAASFLEDGKDDQALKELIGGLEGIYVKSFEFDRDGLVPERDVESIRAQLGRGNWKRLVGIKSAREASNAEVYAWVDQGVSRGLAVLLSEPRQLTIVNVVGRIDLEKLRKLEGQLGVPKLGIDQGPPKD